jgi:putative flippase GtrA
VQHHAIISPTGRARAGQILKSACVGCMGVAVNTVVLYIQSRGRGLALAASSAIAIVAKFNVAALSGLAVNVVVVWLPTRLGMYFITANLAGITLGFAGNYALSSAGVWGRARCR